MKKIISTTLLCVCLLSQLFSQTSGQEYTNRMNHIFQHVDKSRITTGLLSDYGLQLVEPNAFNGVLGDSNYVNIDTWKMLYSGMFTSKINNNIVMTLPETVFNQIDNATNTDAVPVAMMHYQYNQLNENALNLNLLRIINADQLQDVPGAALPYVLKHLFAVAPKTLEFLSGTVSFVFNSNLWYQNVNKTIQTLEINFNNESGYRLANWNTPINYTFRQDGIKTIYFRLTYTDGTSYTSQTNIFVTGATPKPKSILKDDSVHFPANSVHSGGGL